jgi:hypothetical protein
MFYQTSPQFDYKELTASDKSQY